MQRWEGYESQQSREKEHVVFWNWEAGEAKGSRQNGHWVEIQRFLPGVLGHLLVHCSVGAGETPEVSEQAVIGSERCQGDNASTV